MRILLDTHIWIWWLAGDKRLPPRAAELIKEPDNEIFVSAINVWEVALKTGSGGLDIDPAAVEAEIALSHFLELPVTARHAVQVSKLPQHHGDPFDRMLIAQSLVEPMRLLTHDKALARYGETILLV